MTVELARRLMLSGVVSPADVADVLLSSVTQEVPFVALLAERGGALAQLVERELARAPVPAIQVVRPVPELCARLPRGMSGRLLAVPVREDPRTGTIDVATADPFDSQVAAEFVFQLGAPVRILRAPLSEVSAAIEAFEQGQAHGDRTPAFGTRVVHRASVLQGRMSTPPEPHATTLPSQPPIPLVRSLRRRPRPRQGTEPGVGSGSMRAVDLPEEDESGEPVINLFRAKSPPSDPAVPISSHDEIGTALMALAAAESGEAVIEQLCAGLASVARRVAVFVPRGASFEARASVPRLAPDRLKRLRVTSASPSVVSSALEAGYYLGRLPECPELGDLFEADHEVYVLPVLVAKRPALIVIMAAFQSAFSASRRADQLGEAAGRALERIVRARKRSP